MQNLFVRSSVTFLLSLMSLMIYAQEQLDNEVPVVKIIKPKTTETLNRNTLVPYTIHVNDREDGNSTYEEIAGREVMLIVKYLEDSALANEYVARIDQELSPLIAMSKSTCLNCHAASSKLIGPSFDLIAKKYGTNNNAKAYLTKKIKTGSTGIWGEEKMPPQPDLNNKEVELIVDWILNQKDDPTQFHVGLQGAIRINDKQANSNKQVCILTAAYQDHGVSYTQKDQKLGRQTIILKMKP